jgi:hypothetical protein
LKIKNREWKMESGKCLPAPAGKVESGKCLPAPAGKVESGKLKMESGKLKVESGKLKIENGKWKMPARPSGESGKWKVENGIVESDEIDYIHSQLLARARISQNKTILSFLPACPLAKEM